MHLSETYVNLLLCSVRLFPHWHFSVNFERGKQMMHATGFFPAQNERTYMEIYTKPHSSQWVSEMYFRIVPLRCPWAEQLSGTANASVDLA